jgi:hypothetical protein
MGAAVGQGDDGNSARAYGVGIPHALLSALLFLAYPAELQAAGAFAVDDAEVGDPGTCKVESWASWADNAGRDFIGVVSPACVANIGRPVELGVAYVRDRIDGEWGHGLAAKAKINLIPVAVGGVGVGLGGAIGWNLVSSLNTAVVVNVPVTWQVSEPFKINVNGGWLWKREPDSHWFIYGAGFEWNFVKPLTLIGEVFGEIGRRIPDTFVIDPEDAAGGLILVPGMPRSVTDPRIQVGLRYTPTPSFDVDVVYGRNITGENANWITVGLNVRFGS